MAKHTMILGDRTVEMMDSLAEAYDRIDGTKPSRTDVVRMAIAALYKREQDGGVLAEKTRG